MKANMPPMARRKSSIRAMSARSSGPCSAPRWPDCGSSRFLAPAVRVFPDRCTPRKSLHPPKVGCRETAHTGNRIAADTMATRQLLNRGAGLVFLQDRNDLLFRIPLSSCWNLLLFNIQGNPTSRPDRIKGLRSLAFRDLIFHMMTITRGKFLDTQLSPIHRIHNFSESQIP